MSSLDGLCSHRNNSEENASIEQQDTVAVLDSFSGGEVSPIYEKLLEKLGYDVNEALRFEHLGWEECKCEGEEVDFDGLKGKRGCRKTIYQPIIEVGRKHPWYSMKHHKRCASETKEQLDFLAGYGCDNILRLDLTVPKWVSRQLGGYEVKEKIREAFKMFVKELEAFLFPHYPSSQIGVKYALHLWSTKNPLEKHLHIHAIIPNIVYRRKDGEFHRFKPWIDHKDMKKLWRKVLRKNGLWDDPGMLPDARIRYTKMKEAGKVVHRLKYMFRKPVVDLNEYLDEKALEDFDEDFARELLRYTPRRYNLGFFCNLKQFGFSSGGGKRRCPICGCPLVVYGRVSKLPDGIPCFKRNREGGFELTEPPPTYDELKV